MVEKAVLQFNGGSYAACDGLQGTSVVMQLPRLLLHHLQ